MFKPWSVVSDEELKHLRQMVKEVQELKRGCDCDYDHRCRNCSKIINIKALAVQAEKAR